MLINGSIWKAEARVCTGSARDVNELRFNRYCIGNIPDIRFDCIAQLLLNLTQCQNALNEPSRCYFFEPRWSRQSSSTSKLAKVVGKGLFYSRTNQLVNATFFYDAVCRLLTKTASSSRRFKILTSSRQPRQKTFGACLRIDRIVSTRTVEE